MASNLASTWGWGPLERRSRAEIPGLIEMNARAQLPESGATERPGSFPGNRTPRPTSRRIRREIPNPAPAPGGFPGKLEIPRGSPGGVPGGCISLDLGCRVRLPGKSDAAARPPRNPPGNPEVGISPGGFPGKFGRGGRISLFSPHSGGDVRAMCCFVDVVWRDLNVTKEKGPGAFLRYGIQLTMDSLY